MRKTYDCLSIYFADKHACHFWRRYLYRVLYCADSLRRRNQTSSILPRGIRFTSRHSGSPKPRLLAKKHEYKALFVQNMLSKYPDKAVVYVDADAVIRSYPALFDELNCDIAVHHYDNKKRGFKELLSGTVYFGATPKARELVESWVQVNKEFPDQWDQKNLAIAIERAKNLNVAELPASYCLIFDLMKDQGPAVIERFQASRRFKGQIHEDTVTTE